MESWADIVEYGDDNLDDFELPWLYEDGNSDGTEDEQLLDDTALEDSTPHGARAPVFTDERSWAQVAAAFAPSPAERGARVKTEGAFAPSPCTSYSEGAFAPSPCTSYSEGGDRTQPAKVSFLPSVDEAQDESHIIETLSAELRTQADDSAAARAGAFVLSPAERRARVKTAGEPIGIRAVQSILMSATQMNLSHFHTAGMDTAGAASNVMPSAAEAMDSVYTKKNTSMRFETSADIRNIRRHIVGANFGSFVITIGSSFTLFPDRENIWYEALGVPMHSDVLRFYIDYKKMRNHGLTLTMLAQEAFGDDCSWRVSPDFMGMIDIETSGMHMSLWLSRMEQCVCGTPNIMSCDMLSLRRHSDKNPSSSSTSAELEAKAVVTRGTDIYAVSKIPEVDKKTIVSNNVAEVERMFGIEAAAGMLSKLIGPRIVSDFMTRTGTVLPFHKRDEIKSKGLLTCMGFERPKDDIRAAVISNSKIQKTKNVQTYEAIMTGLDPFMGFDVIT